MRISAIGTWTHRCCQRGFTLLEIMVTLILIGIIASFAILSLHDGDPSERLATEGRRLSALLMLTQQEALLRGEQRGVRFTETSYGFLLCNQSFSLCNQNDAWRPLTDSTLLQEYQLPPGLQLKLWVENRIVDFTKTATQLPHVLLLSNGEVTAFKVVFSSVDDPAQDYQIIGDVTGHFHFGPAT